MRTRQGRQGGQGRQANRLVTLGLPILLLVALAAAFFLLQPAQWLDNGAPPAEELTFERVELAEGKIIAHVRNAVSAPVSIAQVMVDDAFWKYEISPGAELDGYARGTVTIPYPWVEGEPHVVAIITHTGLVWEHEIVVATTTPVVSSGSLGTYALIGLLVGFVPVAAGMAFYPAMRDASARWTTAILAFTLGLLAFLAVDAIGEGLELAEGVPGSYQGVGVFFGAALLALVVVLAIERATRSTPWSLALLIAIGIGLHNLGEGLLIGSAFSVGALALGGALILGFAIHNVTEGPAIVAPLAAARRKGADAFADASSDDARARSSAGLGWKRFALLAAAAGLPTVLGAWLGAFYATGILSVLFFGLGSGAIVVVLIQVGRELRKEGEALTVLNMVGFALGYLVMIATSLLTT